MGMRWLAALAATLLLSTAAQSTSAAKVRDIKFQADLTGMAYPDETGSEATGHALITLHPGTQTVDVKLDVIGLHREALWDRLVAAPVGPMHIHLYLPNGAVELIMAFPYGKAYRDTPKGLSMHAKGIVYSSNAGLVGSNRSFGEFAEALRSGNAYLNIHTDTFNDGEIAGKISERR